MVARLINIQNTLDSKVPEIKKSSHILILKSIEPCELFAKYLDIGKLKRITSYCLRFIANVRKKCNDRNF